MRDKEIDEILKQAAQAPHNVDPALLDRIGKSIGSSLRPVRPLPPAWELAGGLFLICAGVALAGAARVENQGSFGAVTDIEVLGQDTVARAKEADRSEAVEGS